MAENISWSVRNNKKKTRGYILLLPLYFLLGLNMSFYVASLYENTPLVNYLIPKINNNTMEEIL